MPYDPVVHHRRSIRLQGYDYAQEGAYYVTLCVHHHVSLFGHIVDYAMVVNDAGGMVESTWFNLPGRSPSISVDEFVVMPNYFYGIIFTVGAPFVGAQIKNNNRVGTRPAPTLGAIVGAFKSITTNEYIKNVKQHNWTPFPGRLWQRYYYERVIHNYKELLEI